MKKHWLIYIVVGSLFGVFDFFYQQFIPCMISSHMTSLIVVWGIWLIPIIPVAIYESKVSQSRFKASLVSMLTWNFSIITYYLIIPIKLVFIGQASRQELYIANYRDQYYWSNFKSMFLNDVLASALQWIGVAIIGGGIIGFLTSCIYFRLRKTYNLKKNSNTIIRGLLAISVHNII